MIKDILQNIGYFDILRQEKNIHALKDKQLKLNIKCLFLLIGIISLIGLGGGFFIHRNFYWILFGLVPSFIIPLSIDAEICDKARNKKSQINLEFFEKIESNPEYLKEIAKLSVDEKSQSMFLRIVDNFLKKNDKKDLLKILKDLIEYNELLDSNKSYLSQRDSFLSSLGLPVPKKEVTEEKSFQDKARERVLEML